jgi:hypothetical protein
MLNLVAANQPVREAEILHPDDNLFSPRLSPIS